MEIFLKNPLFVGVRLPEIGRIVSLQQKLPNISPNAMSWLQSTLIYDPEQRATTQSLTNHAYFQEDNFAEKFELELKHLIEIEKEKELADRAKRKRSKRISEVSRTPTRRDSRHSLEEIENSKK